MRSASEPHEEAIIPYQAILVLHLVAVSVFIGGLMMVAIALPSFSRRADPAKAAELRRLIRFNRYLITTALGCVWLLGLTLATEAEWFVAPWLQVKIVFVALLSALHGIQSARLRRISRSPSPSPAIVGWWPLLLIAVVATIIGLAADKPTLWG